MPSIASRSETRLTSRSAVLGTGARPRCCDKKQHRGALRVSLGGFGQHVVNIYIYIYRERAREREIDIWVDRYM